MPLKTEINNIAFQIRMQYLHLPHKLKSMKKLFLFLILY